MTTYNFEKIEEVKNIKVEKKEPKVEKVNHPKHYQLDNGVEVLDIIKAQCNYSYEGYLEGNAIKYLLRWRKKNGIVDLKKCIFHLVNIIELYEPDYKLELIEVLNNETAQKTSSSQG